MDFRLTDAMRRQGVADAGAISLAVDGTDVSARAAVGGTLDFPQSRAFVTYRPQAPLADGQRRAVASFPRGSGRVTYAWTFVVADVPCP